MTVQPAVAAAEQKTSLEARRASWRPKTIQPTFDEMRVNLDLIQDLEVPPFGRSGE